MQTTTIPTLERIKELPKEFEPAIKLLFSSDYQTLFLAKRGGDIDTYTIRNDGEIEYEATIVTKKGKQKIIFALLDINKYFGFAVIKDTLSLLTTSKCGKYLVCAGTCLNIAVFQSNKKNGKWIHHLNLPKYNAQPTAIAIHENSPLLVVTFADSKVK